MLYNFELGNRISLDIAVTCFFERLSFISPKYTQQRD